MTDELESAIRENASGPAKGSCQLTGRDAGSVEQHKLTEQIAAGFWKNI